MKRYGSILIVFWMVMTGALAQEVHFSQYYASPMLLNPALTGATDYTMRAGTNYRNQWNTVTVPFVSYSAFADGKLFLPEFISKGWFGLGLMAFSDKAGTGALQSNQMTFSFSYNHQLTPWVYFSLGGGVEMINKSVDFNKLSFEDEWNGNQGDFGNGTMEPFTRNSFFYLDGNFGMLLTWYFSGFNRFRRHNEDFSRIFLGASVYHLGQPKETFYEYDDYYYNNHLKTKWVLHGGYLGRIGRSFYLKPEFITTLQSKLTDVQVGCNMAVGGHNQYVHFGAWTRVGKDIIPVVGYENSLVKILFSYDINISELAKVTNPAGGMEISATFYLDYSRMNEVRHRNRRRRRGGPIFGGVRTDYQMPKL